MFDKEKTDSEKDENYYFKDSRGPTLPHIIIPKKRGTWQHFRYLDSNPNAARSLKKFFAKHIQGIDLQQSYLNSQASQIPFWTVKEAFLLSMETP